MQYLSYNGDLRTQYLEYLCRFLLVLELLKSRKYFVYANYYSRSRTILHKPLKRHAWPVSPQLHHIICQFQMTRAVSFLKRYGDLYLVELCEMQVQFIVIPMKTAGIAL